MSAVLHDLLPILAKRLAEAQPRPLRGRIRSIRGTLIHASVAGVGIGELCRLSDPLSQRALQAEVVGFDGDEVILAPIGSLEGLSTRTEIVATGERSGVLVGDALLG